MPKYFPSPAMAVALVALGIALGGSAVEATNGLITGAQIKNHSIGLNDLSYSAIAKLRGDRGPRGPEGRPGPAGTPAPPLSTKLTIQSAQTLLAAGTVGSATASCPTGTLAISGGAHTNGLSLWADQPIGLGGTNTGWLAGATASSLIQSEVNAYAICLSP